MIVLRLCVWLVEMCISTDKATQNEGLGRGDKMER